MTISRTESGNYVRIFEYNGFVFTGGPVEMTGAQEITGGITLNNTTTGYVPASLNYYEEFSLMTTVSGIWAATQPALLKIIRVGKLVTLHLSAAGANATAASFITLDTTLAARFRPNVDMQGVIFFADDGTNGAGVCNITSAGVLTIYAGGVGDTFAGTSASAPSGYNEFSVSYILN